MSETMNVSGMVAEPSSGHDFSQTATPDKTVTVSRGKVLVAALSLYGLLLTLVFRDTLISMASVWMNSDTYAHGFLILPICLYLAWRLRDRFHTLIVRPEPRALVLVLGAGLVWLLGNIVDVQVVQRVAFVAMLVSGFWAIAGNAVARAYAFPLGFLFLAVPLGSGLIQPLMVITAETLEFSLRASGIPVFREGLYLYLPTGTWSVIEECSGLNYVIASVTLGLCYAHLNYTSMWRKTAFVAAAMILPVVANSLRAYLVVMIGHLSDMRYGTGFDHLVYGWIMFGVVMMLMFWIGSFWQQDQKLPATSSGATMTPQHPPVLALTVVTGLALLCAVIWPAAAFAMNRSSDTTGSAALTIPPAKDSWQVVDSEDWRWRPPQPGANRMLDQVYSNGTADNPAIVALHLRQYLQQEQGAELVETFNAWRPDFETWRVADQQHIVIDLDGPVNVTEAWVMSAADNLLIWSWYRVDGHNTANHYLVKILEAKQQVMEGDRQGTRIFIATPFVNNRTEARQVLQDFVTDHYSAIEAALEQGIGDAEATDTREPSAQEPSAEEPSVQEPSAGEPSAQEPSASAASSPGITQ